MSPMSLKITFEQIERGAHLTLQDCLSMEYRLTQRCCEDNDFYEGKRIIVMYYFIRMQTLIIEINNMKFWIGQNVHFF